MKYSMKNSNYGKISFVLAASIAVLGCNPLSKMAKKANSVTYDVTPNPTEMHGDSVAVTISGKYPGNFFHKKAKMVITPYMAPSGDETGSESIQEFKGISLIGEAADGEGTKISYAQGGSFSYTDVIAYDKAMMDVDLRIKAVASFKSKSKEFPSVKIADGTNVTPLLVQKDNRPILGKDKFTKTVPVNFAADIHYLVNSSVVRSGELRDKDIKELEAFVKGGVEKEYVFKSVNVEAYASPEGEISKNENLADDRAKSAKTAVQRILNQHKVEAAKNDDHYGIKGKGEDWAGFKQMMEASDIKDKDLIIRILEMHSDVTKREEEIKNLAATYVEVQDKILPKLRRSQIVINAEEKSKTDEEIQTLASAAPDTLTEEELLYAATLTNNSDEKMKVYQAFSQVYPKDWRGPNNMAYLLIQQNKLNEAQEQLEKAAKIASDNPIVKNNMGIIAHLKGDRKKAEELFSDATGAGKEVNYNLGVINIQNGDYAGAVANFSGSQTFNAALAKYLNKDVDGALSTLEASDDKDSAVGNYLKALIGASKDDKDMLFNSLKAAVSKDASLKERAKKDVEFMRFKSEEEFKSIVG